MADRTVKEGTLLWEPSAEVVERSNLRRYQDWLAEKKGLELRDYPALYQWSVNDIEAFWESIWEFFGVLSHKPYSKVLGTHSMPGATWFESARLNYAEHALSRRDDHTAIVYRSEDGSHAQLSYRDLADQVRKARAGLQVLGVQKGDRIAAFVPNSPEAIVAFLAAASLGATWSSCSPEFGVKSVLDRFSQIEPKVLIAVDGYAYNGKFFDRQDAVREIEEGLPTLERTVLIARAAESPGHRMPWEEFLLDSGELAFDPLPFDHPLWVLYSSGTTGLPKPIVHSQGGILLEHLKALSLHCDLGPDDRFFWFTTTGWMMWNFLIGGLLVGSTVVLYEGSPAHPDMNAMWKLAEEERVTYFGTSAPFLLANKKAGLVPKDVADLRHLRALGSTGAPLPADGFGWVYENVKRDLLLGSVSGGTDVCTAFVLSAPLLPVHAGEIQCHGLGCKIESLDADGKPVENQVGELVITEPMPSMPIYFWNDEGGKRLHESYFAQYPGIWRHGDWIKVTPRGSSVIYGRSDSTLNRGGVRMGTSEFYRIVDNLPEVADSVVIDTGSLDDEAEGKLWLFVVPAEGIELDDAAKKKIRATIRTAISPRHVPDAIHVIAEVPRTLSGKKLEVPLKKILNGMPIAQAANPDTLANPRAIEAFLEFATKR